MVREKRIQLRVGGPSAGRLSEGTASAGPVERLPHKTCQHCGKVQSDAPEASLNGFTSPQNKGAAESDGDRAAMPPPLPRASRLPISHTAAAGVR